MSRDQAIADYLGGLMALRNIAEADSRALAARPGEDEWSAAWVMHHLADSEAVNGDRLRRMLTESEPLLRSFDALDWTRELHYDQRDPRASVALVVAMREANVALLTTLSPAQWERTGVHESAGRMTVANWMASQTTHLHEHVLQALEALGHPGP